MGTDEDAIARVFRAEHGRAVAVLARSFGDLDVAEESVQDAFVAAVQHWPTDGVPPSPAGWIITTAKRKAIDRLRREASRDDRHAQAALLHERDDPVEVGPVRDDRLRLVFTCCHPALSVEAQVALTLRLLGGLSTDGDRAGVPGARADDGPAPGARQGQDPRRPHPATASRPTPTCPTGSAPCSPSSTWCSPPARAPCARDDLCAEAIRLGRVLVELMPDEPEALGLLALMLLTDARRDARVSADGSLVLLRDQDRSLLGRRRSSTRAASWSAGACAATTSVRTSCRRRCRRCTASPPATDWRQIVILYDQLMSIAPSPVVALNRAVAVAELDGPAAGLALVDDLPLDRFYLFHAVRADLLRRLDRPAEAVAAYDEAAALTMNEPERDFLLRQRTATALP